MGLVALVTGADMKSRSKPSTKSKVKSTESSKPCIEHAWRTKKGARPVAKHESKQLTEKQERQLVVRYAHKDVTVGYTNEAGLAWRRAAAKLYPDRNASQAGGPIRIWSLSDRIWVQATDGVYVFCGCFVPKSEAVKAALLGDKYDPHGTDKHGLKED